MKLTFLGTGTSFGVPQIGCNCAVCNSADPRDRRTRVAAVVESAGGVRILIDTPPELRVQLLATGIDSVDAVLYTHDHADHTHGIDDLRAITMRRGDDPLPLYASREVLERMTRRFPYIFDANIRPAQGTTKPEAAAHVIERDITFRLGDSDIVPVAVPHGDIPVLAFRIGPIAYVTDAKAVPEDAREKLKGVKVLVLNALLRKPHPTHLSISEAIEVSRAIGAERTFLTHLTHGNFHANLESELPSGIAPAYDGLVVQVN